MQMQKFSFYQFYEEFKRYESKSVESPLSTKALWKLLNLFL